MPEVVEIPARLAEAVAAAPTKPREPVPGQAVSFRVAGAHVTLDSNAVAALVSASLQHEATLHQLATRVGMSVDELMGSLQRTVTETGSSSFTDSEINVLAAAHVDLAGPAGGAAGVELAGRAAAHRLVAEALTIEQAAAALSVTPGRVRQRLAAGELLDVRRPDGQIAIPRWQIRDGRTVPGLKLLFAEVPELHPLAVARFMTAPHPELELDEEAASPSDWLLTGGEVEPVMELLHSVALRG